MCQNQGKAGTIGHKYRLSTALPHTLFVQNWDFGAMWSSSTYTVGFRYQFFLQVKEDIFQGRLPVSHELAVELASLALQCKKDDHTTGLLQCFS
jgi:hypothetical protein